MKKNIPMFLLLILLIILLTPAPACANNLEISVSNNEKYIEKSNYIIENITPKDDAFHGIKNHLSQEWWYFDAVFNENYGVHIGIRVTSLGKWGFVRQFVNIYNDTEVEEKIYITRPLSQFQISEDFPDIKHKNNPLLKFDYDEYNKTGNWNYTVTIDVGKLNVNLTFIGKSKGFTYTTSHEGWTVAQPKADVVGKLSVNDKIIHINGTGYHDHNWEFSLRTALRAKGWYWGKINSQNYSLTWANIIKTRFADDTISEKLGILSIVNDDFIKINPDNITFTISDYKYHSGRFIPTKFSLYTLQDDLEINVSFNAVSIQRTEPSFLTIHYWRYFISITGFIRVDTNIDYIENDIQIMEFLRFI